MSLRLFLLPLFASLLLACRGREVTVELQSDKEHTFTRDEQRAIEDVATNSIQEVRRLLPALPPTIVVTVRASRSVIAETHESGSSSQPNTIHWLVDASAGGGVTAIAKRELRATLFHELHHLVRGAVVVDTRLKDDVVREGLATAFERDFAGAKPPWGQVPPLIPEWTTELLALPDDAPRHDWLFQHPDGRRWIGVRVGTYLVDHAMKKSDKTSADLVWVPTDSVLAAALAP